MSGLRTRLQESGSFRGLTTTSVTRRLSGALRQVGIVRSYSALGMKFSRMLKTINWSSSKDVQELVDKFKKERELLVKGKKLA